MPQPIDHTLAVLRAIGEGSRLRIVAALRHGELTVSDLTDTLGQSQPRVSRHLRLLTEAGVVTRHREGAWAFYSLANGEVRTLVDAVLASIDPDDGELAADRARLTDARTRRSRAADAFFAEIADRWDEERSLHAPDAAVEAEITTALADRPADRLVDLGTGTGRMLHLLTDVGHGARLAVGLDASHSMLAVARAHLERAGLRDVELRQGDVYGPPLPAASFDLVVVHQVLHFLDDPARAVAAAARLLAPGGRLAVIDFAPHNVEFLRTEHAHRRLGFRDDLVRGWFADAGLVAEPTRSVDPPTGTDPAAEQLTVSIWLAGRTDVDERLGDVPELAGAER